MVVGLIGELLGVEEPKGDSGVGEPSCEVVSCTGLGDPTGDSFPPSFIVVVVVGDGEPTGDSFPPSYTVVLVSMGVVEPTGDALPPSFIGVGSLSEGWVVVSSTGLELG